MHNQIEITEETAFEQDVKTMSYDELMATIRYLDEERQAIKERVTKRANDTEPKVEIIKRAA